MILAIDTSTQWMGLALYDGSQVLYEKVWRTNRRHTVELIGAFN
jgi:tRNA threonylcarbamoyladenosine biosynthesis protein TsaB